MPRGPQIPRLVKNGRSLLATIFGTKTHTFLGKTQLLAVARYLTVTSPFEFRKEQFGNVTHCATRRTTTSEVAQERHNGLPST